MSGVGCSGWRYWKWRDSSYAGVPQRDSFERETSIAVRAWHREHHDIGRRHVITVPVRAPCTSSATRTRDAGPSAANPSPGTRAGLRRFLPLNNPGTAPLGRELRDEKPSRQPQNRSRAKFEHRDARAVMTCGPETRSRFCRPQGGDNGRAVGAVITQASRKNHLSLPACGISIQENSTSLARRVALKEPAPFQAVPLVQLKGPFLVA
jgi:hypothetical protein